MRRYRARHKVTEGSPPVVISPIEQRQIRSQAQAERRQEERFNRRSEAQMARREREQKARQTRYGGDASVETLMGTLPAPEKRQVVLDKRAKTVTGVHPLGSGSELGPSTKIRAFQPRGPGPIGDLDSVQWGQARHLQLGVCDGWIHLRNGVQLRCHFRHAASA
jgi:hypothetical protein